MFLSALLFVCTNAIAQPPATPRIPVIDDYFGLKVTDYYCWMENLKDGAVMKLFEAQYAYAENIFDHITGRDGTDSYYDW